MLSMCASLCSYLYSFLKDNPPGWPIVRSVDCGNCLPRWAGLCTASSLSSRNGAFARERSIHSPSILIARWSSQRWVYFVHFRWFKGIHCYALKKAIKWFSRVRALVCILGYLIYHSSCKHVKWSHTHTHLVNCVTWCKKRLGVIYQFSKWHESLWCVLKWADLINL